MFRRKQYCQFTRLTFWYLCGNQMNCKTSGRSKVSIMPLYMWRKCHMMEAVIGHGQLQGVIICLALKPHSTVRLDNGTVKVGDGSVWPLGVAYQHGKCPWPRTALTFPMQSLAQGCFERVCSQICASRSSQTKKKN